MLWLIGLLCAGVVALGIICFWQRQTVKELTTGIQRCYDQFKQLEAERDQFVTALNVKNKEVTALTAERDGLLEANTKLANDYDTLSKQMPGLRPKAVRWSGPGGARERAEVAARSKANSQQEMPHAD